MTAEEILIQSKPCKKCSSIERSPRGDCKACARVRIKEWTAANKEKQKATNAAWKAKNSERVKAVSVSRYASNKEFMREQAAKWYKNNSEKVKEKSRIWQSNNLDKRREWSVLYRAKNPEKTRAWALKWEKANPDALRINRKNRKSRERSAGGKLSTGLISKLFQLQKGICPCCSILLGVDYHLDHIIPIALGGRNDDSNMQLLRRRCNQQKSAKHPVDYMQSKGFLL